MLKYLCAPLALLALAVAGCGEDKPSKKEFVADLDAVCKKSNEKIQKLDNPTTIKQIPTFVRESRVVLDDSIKEAEKLELPDEDGDKFKSYISDSKKSLSALNELEQAAEQDNEAEIKRIFTETTKDNQKRDAEAKGLGLKQCGSG